METENGRIGASFTDFLDDQGARDDVAGQAVKELLAEQISAAMTQEGLSKVAMARRMQTTRAQPDGRLCFRMRTCLMSRLGGLRTSGSLTISRMTGGGAGASWLKK